MLPTLLGTQRAMHPERRKAIHKAMVRFADGDRSAIDVLVGELWPVLLAFARRGLGSEQDSEDVAQEVFERLCSRVGEFDRRRDGLSWAFGIAGYEIMSQRRRRLRRREAPDDGLQHQADDATLPDEELDQRNLLSALEAAIGSLTDDDRDALLNESGLALGHAPATLRKRKQRALERLRVAWRSLYGGP